MARFRRVRDDHGRWLNIEMQTSIPGELPQRLAYYVANQYVTQMREGDAYQSLLIDSVMKYSAKRQESWK